jgi:uncharacterized protein (DUF433 family)
MNDLIESQPDIMFGKPVIRGTRITVQLIVEALAAGESIEQLLDSYPNLDRGAVLAALRYAARAVAFQPPGQLIPAR